VDRLGLFSFHSLQQWLDVSVASTTVSSAKVAAVGSGVLGCKRVFWNKQADYGTSKIMQFQFSHYIHIDC
jgi:hypothetical protein